MLAAKTQPAKAKSAPPAEKAKSSTQPPAEAAFNPVWGRLALGIQPKLKVSAPDDPAEAEADRVADTVMRMPEPVVQRKCAACTAGGATCPDCEEEARMQRKADGANGAGEAPSIVGETLRAGRGQPLDAEARAYFEPRFGQDFSRVRVHTDERAGASACAVNALAYTVGPDIVFGPGRYAPAAPEGRRLLAHELTHVVQQQSTSFGSVVRLQRQPAGMGQSDCGPDFKRKFLGEINQEKPEAHRGVPRMYYATTAEKKEVPGEPVEPLVPGTELDAGQTGGYAGLWRAVCFKTKKMPVQILWVLNEYVSNLDEQRRKEQERKEQEKKAKDAEERKPSGDDTPPAQPEAPMFIGSSTGDTAAVGTEVEYRLWFRTPPLTDLSIRWFQGRVVNGEVQPLKLHGFPGRGVTHRHLWEDVGEFVVMAVVGPDSDESHVTFKQRVVTADDKDSPLTKGAATNIPVSTEAWLADRDTTAAQPAPLPSPIQSSANPIVVGDGAVEFSVIPLEEAKSFFWFVQPTDPDGFQGISDPRVSGVWRGEWRGMPKKIYRGQKVLVSSAAGSSMRFPLAQVGTYIVSCEERDGDGKELRTSRLSQEIQQKEKVDPRAAPQRQEFVHETDTALAELASEDGKKKAVPVRAEFLAKAGGRSDHLVFFIGPKKEGGGLVLIDLQRGVSTRSYYGGTTTACFADFGSKRSYPPGKIGFTVPAKPEWGIEAFDKVLDVEPSTTDKAIAIIGQIAGLAAGPLFFIAPPLAAVLQIISSAANIWENYQTRKLLTKSTAIDVMMMAAAFVPLGGTLATRLEAEGLKEISELVGKWVHVIGYGSGVAGGVLISEEGVRRLVEISNSNKSPEEKGQEMAQALSDLVLGTLMLALVVLPEGAGPKTTPQQAEPQSPSRAKPSVREGKLAGGEKGGTTSQASEPATRRTNEPTVEEVNKAKPTTEGEVGKLTGEGDKAAKRATDGETPAGEKVVAEKPTFDGKSKVKVTDKGKAFVCTTCEEIQIKYREELKSSEKLRQKWEKTKAIEKPEAKVQACAELQKELAEIRQNRLSTESPTVRATRLQEIRTESRSVLERIKTKLNEPVVKEELKKKGALKGEIEQELRELEKEWQGHTKDISEIGEDATLNHAVREGFDDVRTKAEMLENALNDKTSLAETPTTAEEVGKKAKADEPSSREPAKGAEAKATPVETDPQAGVKTALERMNREISDAVAEMAEKAKEISKLSEEEWALRKRLEKTPSSDPGRAQLLEEWRSKKTRLTELQEQQAHRKAINDADIKTRTRLKNALDAQTYARPGFSAAERTAIWDAAMKEGGGKVKSPSGTEIKPGDPWEVGHKPKYEFWKHVRSAAERGITREQFLRECKTLDKYRPETKADNSSHLFEDKTDAYFGE